jgi:hypothetical protein
VVLYCLPLVKEPEQGLKLELFHAGEVDRVCVGGTLGCRGADLGSARKREHGTEDERVLGQKVSVNTEKTTLDLKITHTTKRSWDGLTGYVSEGGGTTDLEDRHFVCKVKLGVPVRGLCCGRGFCILRLGG